MLWILHVRHMRFTPVVQALSGVFNDAVSGCHKDLCATTRSSLPSRLRKIFAFDLAAVQCNICSPKSGLAAVPGPAGWMPRDPSRLFDTARV
jgi:hypothetical protein